MSISSYTAAFLPGRGVLRIGGEEASGFLQALITNNIENATAENAVYSALLTPQGKFLFDFFIVRDGDDYLLDCERARAADLLKRLILYRLRAKVTLANESANYSVAALWGEGEPPSLPGLAYPDPRTALMGWRAILPGSEPAVEGVRLVPAADYHARRVAFGVGEAPFDIEAERSFPLEANLDDLQGIDFQKGCFVGQEVTSRTKRRGVVRKRLLPCRVEGDMPSPGSPVKVGQREVGTVHSVDNAGERLIALLRLDLIDGAIIEAGTAELFPEKPLWATFHISMAEEEDADG
ncbi:MAG: folate-binding protein [Parvibaculaceae bacterium]|nr:folate-binding protein [Parvibaculaceae bacterium]